MSFFYPLCRKKLRIWEIVWTWKRSSLILMIMTDRNSNKISKSWSNWLCAKRKTKIVNAKFFLGFCAFYRFAVTNSKIRDFLCVSNTLRYTIKQASNNQWVERSGSENKKRTNDCKKSSISWLTVRTEACNQRRFSTMHNRACSSSHCSQFSTVREKFFYSMPKKGIVQIKLF